MTSEEIIQRLLDEKKISAKEAMIILKDLARISIEQIFTPKTIKDFPSQDMPVVMYGVQFPPYTYTNKNPNEGELVAVSITDDTKGGEV